MLNEFRDQFNLIFDHFQDLFDEHAKGILGKIIAKLIAFSENVYEGMDKSQILPLLSVVGTIIFILVVGYFMAYLVYVLIIVMCRIENFEQSSRVLDSAHKQLIATNYQN